MRCQLCDYKEAVQRHEIWFGRGVRQIAIEYGLYIFVCAECHRICHLSCQKRKIQWEILQKLGFRKIDIENLFFIMNQPKKQWDDWENNFMDDIKKTMKRKNKC